MKYYTNKKTSGLRICFVFPLLQPLFFLCLLFCSCVSGNKSYERPDFTDEQIFGKETADIKTELEKNTVRALWRSVLLVRDIREQNGGVEHTKVFSDKAHTLFSECAAFTENLVYKSVEEKQWLQALNIAESLECAYRALSVPFEKTERFTSACAAAESGLKKLPALASGASDKTFSDFIQGSVTVWVDLGVKVEKGMGYAARVIGSGFFIDERGYIITNYHVVADLLDPGYEGYGKLYIKRASDPHTRVPAKIIGWDKTLDLALIKTEIKAPYVFKLGSSGNLSVGGRIYAIGSPAGLESTVTSGIVSSFDRNLLSTVFVMQIDAAVNSGNSGGPLVNERGEVQGIVFAGMPAFQGLNFAVPVEYLKTVLEPLYSGGEVRHVWTGAYGRTYKENTAAETEAGVELLYLMPGGSASRAGLLPGDIISAVNGKRIKTLEDLQFALIACRSGSLALFEYRRPSAGGTNTVPVYLELRSETPGKDIYERENEYRVFYPLFGMELTPASVGNKRKFTVHSIIKGGIADESGFSPNDPVEIIRTKILEEEKVLYAEVYTKKRKSGYLDVNFAFAAPLDSLYFF